MPKKLKEIKNNNQLQNIEFAPGAKFDELISCKGLSIAIKETKKYIYEQCNRKDNTDEILNLYKKQYNAIKYARGRLKEVLISSSSFILTMIFTKFSSLSFSIEFEREKVNDIINVINLLLQGIPIVFALAFFILTITYWVKFMIKTWTDFSSLYDLYILPYLCDMMYKRLKSEGYDPPKIPLDDL